MYCLYANTISVLNRLQEFHSSGQLSRSKSRRLLLLNDLLLCVSVAGRASEVEFPTPGAGGGERLSLKWAVSVRDVEVVDGPAGGTLARLLAPGGAATSGGGGGGGGFSTISSAMSKRASLGRVSGSGSGSNLSDVPAAAAAATSNSAADKGQAENLAQDMADLMHDFDVVSRISALIGTLRSPCYPQRALTTETTARIMSDIQKAIRQKDEEMSYQDACCMQLSVKLASSSSSDAASDACSARYTFQMRDPSVKKEWIVELRLAQLALDPNNSPGWDVLEQERSISTKMPLYVKSLPVLHSEAAYTEVTCGASYSLMVPTPTRTLRKQTYVWVNACAGRHIASSAAAAAAVQPPNAASQLRIFGLPQNHQAGLKELGTVELEESAGVSVKAIVFVPGLNGGVSNGASGTEDPLKCDTVWVGTDASRVVVYSAGDPEKGIEVARTAAALPAAIAAMCHHCDAVWVGLSGGRMAAFRRDPFSLRWDVAAPASVIQLGTEPVACLLPMAAAAGIYAACGKRVWVVDAYGGEQVVTILYFP